MIKIDGERKFEIDLASEEWQVGPLRLNSCSAGTDAKPIQLWRTPQPLGICCTMEC